MESIQSPKFYSAYSSNSPTFYSARSSPQSSIKHTDNSTIKETIRNLAIKILQLLQGINIAYEKFKKDTDETNKWLWIRAQKPQMQQALDRAALTPAAFARLPWHQFLDPKYIRAKWIDKNIDFAVVMIRIVYPNSNVTKNNISEIPRILMALINDDTFLHQYTEIVDKNQNIKQKLMKLQSRVDEEYKSFRTELTRSHKDAYGFELGDIAEGHLRDKMVNNFVGEKMRKAGVIHTTPIGTYWKGGRKTLKNKNKTKKNITIYKYL